MANEPDDPNKAQAWITGTPPDQTIDFYIPRGNTGPIGPRGPIGPSLAVGSVETITGPAVPGTVGPTGLTGPKGDPGGFTNGTDLSTNNLNTIIAPGLYWQASSANAIPANNYPAISGSDRRGTLTVTRWASASWAVQQSFESFASVAGEVRISRRTQVSDGTWTAWKTFNTARVDLTSGRAMYMWDDANQRDQMIYGDTGWRDLTPLVGTAAWLRTRRMGNTVWVWGAAINLAAVAPSEVMFVLPAGFRTGSNSINALIGRDGTAFCIFEVNLNGNLKAPFTGSTPRTTDYYFMVSFPTSESWPTSLPGTASGFIPNL